jgi:hypothetical protein
MGEHFFYERPMVRRLVEIFGDPKPPAKVTEDQFDGFQKELEALARKAWHEISREDYWYYLMDLAYVPLQQDLFDYLFPALLIRWWEGQLDRTGGPQGETDFYRALYKGEVIYRMMDEDRRRAVLTWIVDAYEEGVDEWSGKLSTVYNPNGPDNLHGPLWSFHALGQSLPVIPQIFPRLASIKTEGRAQWWLVLLTGLAYRTNTCPYIPPWTPVGGGGGVYVLESATAAYDNGYLPQNLELIRSALTVPLLLSMLSTAKERLSGPIKRDWAEAIESRIHENRQQFARRLTLFLEYLGEHDLGGRQDIED